MRIINGKRFYKKDMDAAVLLPFDGWDKCGTEHKIYYNPECGFVRVSYNDYSYCIYRDSYYDSPASFVRHECDDYYPGHSFEELIGDVDEDNEVAMQFIEAATA